MSHANISTPSTPNSGTQYKNICSMQGTNPWKVAKKVNCLVTMPTMPSKN